MPDAQLLIDRAREAEARGDNAAALALYTDAIETLGPQSSDPRVATVLRWKGTLLREMGRTEDACRHYLRSLAIAERAGLTDMKAHALNCLAIIAQRRGELREAERLYDTASTLASSCGDTRLVGMIEQNCAVLATMRGDFPSATGSYLRSLEAFEAAGDQQAASWVLNNLGMLHTKSGNYSDGRKCLQRGLRMASQRGDAAVEDVIIVNLAELCVRTGELETADMLCARSIAGAKRRDDRLTVAEALTCRARIERKRGQYDRGIASLRIASFEAEGSEDRMLQAEIQRELGEISRSSGDTIGARRALQEAASEFRTVGALHDALHAETLLSEMSAH
jgi:tetratricopeptide (TPR) repeat protein